MGADGACDEGQPSNERLEINAQRGEAERPKGRQEGANGYAEASAQSRQDHNARFYKQRIDACTDPQQRKELEQKLALANAKLEGALQ